jgi:hypothetical protein
MQETKNGRNADNIGGKSDVIMQLIILFTNEFTADMKYQLIACRLCAAGRVIRRYAVTTP